MELIVEDFWPLFDAYNLEAARPPSVPGTATTHSSPKQDPHLPHPSYAHLPLPPFLAHPLIGLEFFIKELGPLVPTRSTLADDCLGCGGLIDEGEFFFWFPRELFLVSAHFCHPCVAYWMDRLQKRRAKPSGPAVNIKTLTEVVKAKYPQFYDVDKETSPDC